MAWTLPPMGFIKINVDITLKDGQCFIGLIAQGSHGILLVLMSYEELIMNVEATEAKGIYLDLCWAFNNG